MLNKNICILGAAGSIGSRLAITLHQQGYGVTAIVRTLSSAVRIGRFNIPIIPMDLLDASILDLAEVIRSHDIVIDCTYSNNPDYEERLTESRLMARLICDATIEAKVSRIIHYGTISVYPKNQSWIDESVECSPQGDSYGDSKLVAENVFLSEYADTLSITVLQLPIVYGPFMGWSINPVSEMKGATLLFPEDLNGFCSLLFVDDVVKATIQTFSHPATYGQKILLANESISWVEYYQAYADICDSLMLREISRQKYERLFLARKLTPYQKLKRKFINDGDFRQLVLSQWGIRSIYKLVKKKRGQVGLDGIKNSIKESVADDDEFNSCLLLNDNNYSLFDSLPVVRSTKADSLLPLSNNTNFHDGLSITKDWLKWKNLIG